MKGRRIRRAPQERKLDPDPRVELWREIRSHFRDLVESEDEQGYWAWLAELPKYDPDSPAAIARARDAWREALAEKRSRRRPS